MQCVCVCVCVTELVSGTNASVPLVFWGKQASKKKEKQSEEKSTVNRSKDLDFGSVCTKKRQRGVFITVGSGGVAHLLCQAA